MAEADIVKALNKRFEARRAGRATLDGEYRDIRRLISPDSDGIDTATIPGENTRRDILDNTAEMSSELAAPALYSTVADPTSRWLQIEPGRDRLKRNYAAALWCDQATRHVLGLMAARATRWQVHAPKAIRGELDFGTATIHRWTRAGQLPVFRAPSPVTLYPAENAEGVVDDDMRFVRLTARQIVGLAGNDNKPLPDKVRKAWEAGDTETRFGCLHAVFPRREAMFMGSLPKDRSAVAEFYVVLECKNDEGLVYSAGYKRHPYSTARWSPNGDSVWGRGCGQRALADTKSLQELMALWFESVEVATYPPVQLADESVYGSLNMGARAVNFARAEFFYGRSQGAIRSIHNVADPRVADEGMAGIRERIGRAYLTHLLAFPVDPKMTATQSLIIDTRMLQQLSQYVGDLQADLLAPQVEGLFWDELEAGNLPPVPEELDEERLEIVYVSRTGQAQQMAEVAAMSRLWDMFTPVFNLDGQVADNQDFDKAFRLAAQHLGVSLDTLRDEGLVGAMRQRRAEAEEQAAEVDTMERLGRSAQPAAQAIATLEGAAGGGDGARRAA